ncbi:MAG TPA: hypothetical protein ENI23_14660 [bacterium]|nr:hypothetical protein [bacterium]
MKTLEKLSRIIIDWKTKKITSEEAMQRVHKLNNVESAVLARGKMKIEIVTKTQAREIVREAKQNGLLL